MENKQPGEILLRPFDTPLGVPPFDLIEESDFEPAIGEAIDCALAEVDRIASSAEAPTFENTVVALDRAGDDLNRALGVFFPLVSALSSDNLMEISERVMPRLTEYSLAVRLDERLWKRVRDVYDAQAGKLPTPADNRLLETTYKGFARNGARLEGDDRETYRRISQRLSELTTRYGQNLLKEMRQYEIELDADMLAGLPAHVVEQAAALAAERGRGEGTWLFTLQQPTYMAVLRYAERRDVRERFWRLYMARNTAGEFDNRPIAAEIAAERARLARLLGYDTYADYVLENTMAGKPAAVESMLSEMRDAYLEPGRREVAALVEFARRSEGPEFEMMPWDYSFWFNRARKSLFDFDEQALRPYFELSRVVDGVFGLATRLYGVKFNERKDIPVYHPDVRAFEVSDADGSLLGMIYTDFFPRDSKQQGAWMTEFRTQHFDAEGNDVRPLVTIVMNFTKPTPTEPSLLTPREVQTFLHEFGHALHGLFSRVAYESLAGTSVDRDFVELPSQFNENFLTRREFLDSFARHYLTGELIPEAEIKKLIDSDRFGAAYDCLRQLSFGMTDMAWHTLSPEAAAAIGADGVEEFERRAMAPVALLPVVPGHMMSTQFSHIFSGGYAAGYYSYKWAEMLDADAFEAFLEAGVFDRATAERFRREILEKGGSEKPDLLYERFRGKKPTIDALLRRDGITPVASDK